MKKDRFWKYFLGACAISMLGGASVTYGIVKYIAPQNLPAIVLPGAEDVLTQTQDFLLVATTTSIFFQDSIPFGYDKWSWGATVNWRTDTHYFDGAHALKITFDEPWSGVEIAGPGARTAGYRGISLAVFVEFGVEELFLEIYSKDGTLVGRQSINWYMPEKKLKPGVWQQITIPLENFNGITPEEISRVSLIGKHAGTAYFDAIHLVAQASPQTPWALSQAETGQEYTTPSLTDLFAQTTPAPLPYTLELTPRAAGLWHSMTGTFRFAATESLLGLPASSTDSSTVFLGGHTWRNYRVDAVVNWGTASTFSLLARFSDEKNFVSCAFSGYGMYAQLYHVFQGTSVLIAETPELAIPQIDTWKEVSHSTIVQGDKITCLLNGEKILSATLSTMPQTGTVGMEAWSRDPGGVPHRIQSFTVTPL